MVGTLAYLSPEACEGRELDARADIWAFGVMLYELLTLQRPFKETNTAALITSILNKTPQGLVDLRSDIPAPLTTLIERMLIKDRDQRISSIRLVGAALEAIISGADTLTLDSDAITPTPAAPPDEFRDGSGARYA